MNFFEDQEIARKKTKKLVILFLSCVFATATILTFVLSFLLYLNMDGHYTQQNFPGFLQMLQIQYKLVLGAFSIISVTILGVTFSKIYSLGQGGEYIAESLGAKRVKRRGSDPELKKYINIVEEMSIASGVPIPKIYIMENEPAINAFAAGFDAAQNGAEPMAIKAAIEAREIVGPALPRHNALHVVCIDAMHASMHALRPGRPIGEVFDAYARVCDAAGMGQHRLNATGYSLGTTFAPNWMDWPMFYHGNPVEVQENMVFFLHMILMDSDNNTAMCPGQTVVVTKNGCENLSKMPLDLISNG